LKLPVRSVRTAVSIVLSIVAFVFLAVSLVRNREALSSFDLQLTWRAPLILGLFVGAVLLSGVLWGRILSDLAGRSVDRTDAMWAHVHSWLLKYVPGQVGSVAGKVLWGEARGFQARTIVASFAYENVFHLVASLSLSLPVVLAVAPDDTQQYRILIGVVVAVQIGVLLAPIGLRRVAAAKTMVLSVGSTLRHGLAYLLPRLLNGLGFLLVVREQLPTQSVADWIVIGAVYVLAGILGILASGLGVREAVITAVLAPRLGAANALAVAAIARIYASLADVLLLLTYALFRARTPQPRET
jgi:glycosyltransferase 2 family protein